MPSDYQVIIRKATSSFGIQMVGMALGYLYGIIISRLFGAAEFGSLSLGMSALSLLSILSVLGLDRASVKLIARYEAHGQRHHTQQYLKIAFIVGTLASLVLTVLFYYGAEFIAVKWYQKPEMTTLLRLMSPGILMFTLLAISSESMRGFKKIKSYSFFRLTSVQLLSTVLLLSLYLLWPYQWVILSSYIGGLSLATIWSLYHLYQMQSQGVKSTPDQALPQTSSHTSSILSLAIPLALASSFTVIMSQLSLQMVGRYLSQEDAGYFAAAFKISMLTAIALKSVNSITSPQFAEAFSLQDTQRLKKTARFATTLSLIVSLPLIVICLVIPETILSMYGPGFAQVSQVLQILVLGRLVASASGPTVNILQMTGYEKAFRNIIFISLVCLVIMNLLWIPEYGIIGAAWATAISISINNILSLIVIKSQLGFWNFPNFKLKEM